MKTLKGYLREVSDGTYYMHCTDDSIVTVMFTDQVHADSVPLNVPIALSVHVNGYVAPAPCYTRVEQ